MSNIVTIQGLPIVQQIIKDAEAEIKRVTGRDVALVIASSMALAAEQLNKRKVIQDVVCAYYDVDWKYVKSKSRRREYVEPRQVYVYLCQ